MDVVEPSKRVLVVENDEAIADVLMLVLGESDYVADRVSDVEGALDYLQGEPLPAAILLDLCVRGASGISLLQACRQSDRLSRLAILVLTGERFPKFADDLVPDAVILKPFDIDALCVSLDRITDTSEPAFVNAARHPLRTGRAHVD